MPCIWFRFLLMVVTIYFTYIFVSNFFLLCLNSWNTDYSPKWSRSIVDFKYHYNILLFSHKTFLCYFCLTFYFIFLIFLNNYIYFEGFFPPLLVNYTTFLVLPFPSPLHSICIWIHLESQWSVCVFIFRRLRFANIWKYLYFAWATDWASTGRERWYLNISMQCVPGNDKWECTAAMALETHAAVQGELSQLLCVGRSSVS